MRSAKILAIMADFGRNNRLHVFARHQSESLRYGINAECQVYAESVNCDVGSAIARRNDTNSEKI